MTNVPVQETELTTAPLVAAPGKPVDLQPLVDASPELIQRWLKVMTIGDTTQTIASYLLAALIIGSATFLAIRGIIEGQAIAGFLGAAIGYIFAKTGGSS